MRRFLRLRRLLSIFRRDGIRFSEQRPRDPRTTLTPRVVVRSDGFAYITFQRPRRAT